ncbi:hypothetical protein GGI64_004965 [Rhizobium leguminosarum]|uniref:Uncharacterized protein n=1 Tax=Rhizobium leguminosarum TaxID=384 RepID=A0A7Z0E2I9_RHILE|nr:hypothetical protein [Rhizobium leguminosarum]NYJ13878.1 hypothetical protein [Rhizobium leguminosarum]
MKMQYSPPVCIGFSKLHQPMAEVDTLATWIPQYKAVIATLQGFAAGAP